MSEVLALIAQTIVKNTGEMPASAPSRQSGGSAIAISAGPTGMNRRMRGIMTDDAQTSGAAPRPIFPTVEPSNQLAAPCSFIPPAKACTDPTKISMFHETLATYSSISSTSIPGRNSSTNPNTAIPVASHPVQLLDIHRAKVMPMTKRTLRSSESSLSSLVAISATRSMVFCDIASGLCTRQIESQAAPSRITAIGAQMAAHCRKEI